MVFVRMQVVRSSIELLSRLVMELQIQQCSISIDWGERRALVYALSRRTDHFGLRSCDDPSD